MAEWIISILLLIGGSFVLVGSIGLVKMPDFFMRLHGPTKATTLGMACLLTAAMVFFSQSEAGISLKEILISDSLKHSSHAVTNSGCSQVKHFEQLT